MTPQSGRRHHKTLTSTAPRMLSRTRAKSGLDLRSVEGGESDDEIKCAVQAFRISPFRMSGHTCHPRLHLGGRTCAGESLSWLQRAHLAEAGSGGRYEGRRPPARKRPKAGRRGRNMDGPCVGQFWDAYDRARVSTAGA